MSKTRISELTTKLRDAAMLQDPIAMAAAELLRLTLEEVKGTLVMSSGDDTLRHQGAAQQLQRLHKELTTRPPSIKPTE